MGMSFGKKWSSEELEVLKKWCPQNARFASKLLGRPLRAVRAKASGMGLASHTKIPWSEEEKALLARLYPDSSTEELVEKLGRGGGAITAMARKLGLRKVPAWSEEQDSRLRQLYGEKAPLKEIAAIVGKSVTEVRGRVAWLGIRRKAVSKRVLSVIDEGTVVSTCSKHGKLTHKRLKSGKLVCTECQATYYERQYKRKTDLPYKIPIEEVKEYFLSAGYEVALEDYKNTNDRILGVCPGGHSCLVGYTWLQQGHGCPTCAQDLRVKFQRSQVLETYDKLMREVESSKYELLTRVDDFINAHTKVEVKCPLGHVTSIKAYSFIQGHRCGFCYNGGVSKGEKEVLEYIRSIYSGEVEENTKTVVSPYEVDIFIPAQKMAIEYNGLYWHSDELVGKKDYEKYLACQRAGIRYVGIFEDEWLKSPDRVKALIKNLLGQRTPSHKLRPKQLKVREITSGVAFEFLSSYHYLGGRKASFNRGLYYGDFLAGVLQFNPPTRQSKYDIELVRMCLHPDYTIPGLWGFCRKHIFDEEFKGQSIVSFSDNRLHTGSVYEHMGFVKSGVVSPDYYWCKSGVRYHKSRLRKTVEERLTGRTETELRTEQGYFKIYDVGKTRWVLDLR